MPYSRPNLDLAKPSIRPVFELLSSGHVPALGSAQALGGEFDDDTLAFLLDMAERQRNHVLHWRG